MKKEPDELTPILGNKENSAEWVKVDQKMIDWVKYSRGRKTFMRLFDGESVQCENGCGRNLQIGEMVLVLHINEKKRNRVFCSVVCQRQNFFTIMGGWRRKRLPR